MTPEQKQQLELLFARGRGRGMVAGSAGLVRAYEVVRGSTGAR